MVKSKIENLRTPGLIKEMWNPGLPDNDLLNQLREIHEYQVYKPKKEKNNIIVDAGANIGMASLYLEEFAQKVYSLEPNPQIYEALVKNTEGHDKIMPLNYGIFNATGTYKFFAPEDEIPQSVVPSSEKEVTKQINVQLKSIDEFMAENGIEEIDCLKLDVESSEYMILMSEGFDKVNKQISCVVGEGHFAPRGIGFPQMLEFIFKSYGFKYKILKTPMPNISQNIEYKHEGFYKKVTGEFHTNFIAWR